MELCVHVSDLRKSYGEVHAVDGISFDLEYGRVFGFLGPNGAGKTTTIRVLTTLVKPTSGIVKIFGKDIVKHSREIRKRMGVVLQEPSFEANVTVDRALELYGLMWGMPGEKRRDRARELMEKFDLVSFSNMKNDELSIGQRRRVQLAREFMHDMDLLFLDEPTVGLDPSARRMLLDHIKKHVKSGLTVFFTTHIMEEAEYLCDEIEIIDNGIIIAFDTQLGLKQRYGRMNKSIEITFKDNLNEPFIDILKEIVKENKKASDDDELNYTYPEITLKGENAIKIKVNDIEKVISEIFLVVPKNGMEIENISVNSPSLEEIFLSIVGNSRDNFNKI